jgi:hypothetical protein
MNRIDIIITQGKQQNGETNDKSAIFMVDSF